MNQNTPSRSRLSLVASALVATALMAGCALDVGDPEEMGVASDELAFAEGTDVADETADEDAQWELLARADATAANAVGDDETDEEEDSEEEGALFAPPAVDNAQALSRDSLADGLLAGAEFLHPSVPVLR